MVQSTQGCGTVRWVRRAPLGRVDVRPFQGGSVGRWHHDPSPRRACAAPQGQSATAAGPVPMPKAAFNFATAGPGQRRFHVVAVRVQHQLRGRVAKPCRHRLDVHPGGYPKRAAVCLRSWDAGPGPSAPTEPLAASSEQAGSPPSGAGKIRSPEPRPETQPAMTARTSSTRGTIRSRPVFVIDRWMTAPVRPD